VIAGLLILFIVAVVIAAFLPARGRPWERAIEQIADAWAVGVILLLAAVPLALAELAANCARLFVPAVRAHYRRFIRKEVSIVKLP
jgi:membrane protease YdiL (CAAX protease family)